MQKWERRSKYGQNGEKQGKGLKKKEDHKTAQNRQAVISDAAVTGNLSDCI